MQFEKDLASPHAELFLKVRATLLGLEGVTETKKPRITTYGTRQGGLCHLRTMPHGVDIGFLKGVQLQDEQGHLSGTGKAIRVLQLNTYDKPLIHYYLDQALLLVSHAPSSD